jgi:hypothetical protein
VSEDASRFARRFRATCLLLGVALSALLLARTQVGGDQLSLLSRGFRLVAYGELVPYGNPLSGGGYDPGPATSILIALPLAIWKHHLAPVVLIWLTHLAAWFLLDSRLRRVATEGERAAFALVYWLNPWRVGAAAVLWNPYFLFLAGAIHLVTLLDQRERGRFWSSFLHVFTLGFAVQLHPSVLMLGVTSLILVVRRTVRVHWAGAVAGGAAAIATLVPWITLYLERPQIFRGEAEGFLFRALLFVQPWLKGLSYWVRYPSLAVPSESYRFDFSALVGAGVDRSLSSAATSVALAAGGVTVVAALVANLRFFRARWKSGLLPAGGESERATLERIVVAGALACLFVFAMSPTTPQSWQALPLFHLAALPVAFWLGPKFDGEATPARLRARRAAAAAAAAAVLLVVCMGFGARNFRCGGRDGLVFPLTDDSPMLDALEIRERCEWPTNVPTGGWPDGLPKAE